MCRARERGHRGSRLFRGHRREGQGGDVGAVFGEIARVSKGSAATELLRGSGLDGGPSVEGESGPEGLRAECASEGVVGAVSFAGASTKGKVATLGRSLGESARVSTGSAATAEPLRGSGLAGALSVEDESGAEGLRTEPASESVVGAVSFAGTGTKGKAATLGRSLGEIARVSKGSTATEPLRGSELAGGPSVEGESGAEGLRTEPASEGTAGAVSFAGTGAKGKTATLGRSLGEIVRVAWERGMSKGSAMRDLISATSFGSSSSVAIGALGFGGGGTKGCTGRGVRATDSEAICVLSSIAASLGALSSEDTDTFILRVTSSSSASSENRRARLGSADGGSACWTPATIDSEASLSGDSTEKLCRHNTEQRSSSPSMRNVSARSSRALPLIRATPRNLGRRVEKARIVGWSPSRRIHSSPWRTSICWSGGAAWKTVQSKTSGMSRMASSVERGR
ncbi:PE_PGRS family protein [Minicystis rosea]|nr:PE_PGRS family protein [Minicystis rosea]